MKSNRHLMGARGSVMARLISIILMSLFLLPIQAFCGETYRFLRMWPTPQIPCYFTAPQDIALSREGNIYIANLLNGAIQKFSPDGHLITQWGRHGSGRGQLNMPNGVAVDGNGNICVADTFNHRIQIFTGDGELVRIWGGKGGDEGKFQYPYGIAVDGQGHVYVADLYNHRVQKFTSHGKFLAVIGSKGSLAGELRFPYDVAVDARDNLYVADTMNHRIQKFDPDGRSIGTWGREDCTPGGGPGEFDQPAGIFVDGDGFVYVSEVENHRVQKFTPEGRLVARWGQAGFGNSEFLFPRGMAGDSEGNVYVADFSNNRFQKFRPDGKYISKWGSGGDNDGEFAYVGGITRDGKGYVYATDVYNSRVQKFTEEGEFVTSWTGDFWTGGSLFLPNGLAADGSGRVYVVDTGNNRVQIFTENGEYIGKWGGSGFGKGEFYEPGAIALDAGGCVYVADRGNCRIQKFTRDGDFLKEWGSFSLFESDGTFQNPSGLAVDKRGHVYVADSAWDRIQIFTSAGKFVGKWDRAGSGNGEFYGPGGLSIDSEDFVYVADAWNNRIQKFTTDGTYVTQWGSQGSYPGQMNQPAALCVGENGRAYVADTLNNRVQVFEKTIFKSDSRAIIVAGRNQEDDDLWEPTRVCANFAYLTLIQQGFDRDDICYLTSDKNFDLYGIVGSKDVDGDVTTDSLRKAVTRWAKGAGRDDDVIIYLTDHGNSGTFRLNQAETLRAEDLAAWLDELQEKIKGNVIVILDACYSGSFLPVLAGSKHGNRIVILSASEDQKAYFTNRGSISFSTYFWSQILIGSNLFEAFRTAESAIAHPGNAQQPTQQPLLDDNGNGEGFPQDQTDGNLAKEIYIGNSVKTDNKAPLIKEISPEHEITTSGEVIYAVVKPGKGAGASDIDRVWAEIMPPDFETPSGGAAILSLPSVNLLETRNGRYEGKWDGFSTYGNYMIAI